MPCHRKATLFNVSPLPSYKVPAFAVLLDGRLFKTPSRTSKGYVRPKQIQIIRNIISEFNLTFLPKRILIWRKKGTKNRRYADVTLEHWFNPSSTACLRVRYFGNSVIRTNRHNKCTCTCILNHHFWQVLFLTQTNRINHRLKLLF